MKGYFVLSIAAFLVTSCATVSYQQRSSDFTVFFLSQVVRCGGHTRASGEITHFKAQWRFKQDDQGVQVFVRDKTFSEIQGFSQQAFGQPHILPEPGHAFGVYGVRNIGCAIQFFQEGDEVGLICIREQNLARLLNSYSSR